MRVNLIIEYVNGGGKMKFYKELNKLQKAFLLVFISGAILIYLSPIVLTRNIKDIFSFEGTIGLIATICGVLVSVLTAKGKPQQYIFAWGSVILMSIICLLNGLYGQFIQNLFFTLPIQIYGFFSWEKSAKSKDSIRIKKFSVKQWIMAIVVLFVFWFIYGMFLKYLPEIIYSLFDKKIGSDPQLILDALTGVMAIMGAGLTALRFIEQWYFWIIYNLIAIVTFVIQIQNTNFTNNTPILVADLSNTLNLIQYVLGVLYGYALWKSILKKEEKEEAI